MRRAWLKNLTVFSGVTVVAAMVGCCADGTPQHQLIPIKPPLPHHHVYVPNEPLPYQASPHCFGYYPTCWRAWPAECVSCPPASTCGDVIIEDRPLDEVEVIPTPSARRMKPLPPDVETEPVPKAAPPVQSETIPESSPAPPQVEPTPVDPTDLPVEDSQPSSVKPEPAAPPEPMDDSSYAPPPGAVLASDDTIAERVVNRLELQKKRGLLKDFDIEVSVVQGVVTLTGDVTAAKHREAALQATRQAPGVKRIINSLTVTR